VDSAFSLSFGHSSDADYWWQSIFWIVVLGIFAGLYIDNGSLKGGSTRQVKSAAFVDSTNMLLWFITGMIGAALHCLGPRLNR
jgi:hypothetical protein